MLCVTLDGQILGRWVFVVDVTKRVVSVTKFTKLNHIPTHGAICSPCGNPDSTTSQTQNTMRTIGLGIKIEKLVDFPTYAHFSRRYQSLLVLPACFHRQRNLIWESADIIKKVLRFPPSNIFHKNPSGKYGDKRRTFLLPNHFPTFYRTFD